MKSLTGKFASARGWALLLTLFVGAGLFVVACGDEEVPTPTTPAPPPPAPTPTPPPPEPEPEPAPEPPAVPVGLRVSASGVNFIEWSWNAVDGVSGYDVQFSANEAFTDEDETIARTAEEISYRREDLEAETSAFLRVRSAAGTGEERITSDWSTHVTGMTVAPEPELPPAPANLRVKSRGSDYIEWEWDAVAGAGGYQSEFSMGSAFSDPNAQFHQGMSNTERRVSNLDSESDGYLRVRTYTGTISEPQFGEWSEGNMGTTDEPPPAVKLDFPDDFAGSDPDEDSIVLSWGEVDDADSYEVEQRADGGSWGAASCGGGGNVVEDTECVASGLDSGTEYDFRVRALPADDDAAHTASNWTQTRSGISTTGSQPTDTSSMGEGDLNVTWESTDTTITWEWELTEDRDHVYQVALIFDADIDDDSPCPKPTENGWDTGEQDRRRHTVDSGVTVGDVRLLCVQTMWKDDNDVPQYGNMSWAWAATTPPAPANGTHMDKDGKTTTITWDTVAYDSGFNYVFSLASASHEDGNIAASQDACKDGKSLGTETSDFPLADLDYPVKAPTVYTSNRLCYRAENSSGRSEWAIGDPVSTVPAVPSGPRVADSSLDHDETDMSWTVAKKAGTPREHGDYNTVVITDTDQADRNTASVKYCDTDADTENLFDHITNGVTAITTQDGIEVSYSADANTDTTDPKRFYLCVQGKLQQNRAGPWVFGGSVTQAKAPATN